MRTVTTALEVIDDADELDPCCWSASPELGVKPPSLYHHFPDEAERVAAVSARGLGGSHTLTLGTAIRETERVAVDDARPR